MIFLISGKQGSGKSTLTTNLTVQLKAAGYHVLGLKFADPLYRMHDRVLGVLSEEYEMEVPKKDGKLLQLLGTEWGRQVHGENVWVNLAKRKIGLFMDGPEQDKRIAIIDDCRFKNELFGFPEAFKVRLTCGREVRKVRADAWRDTENHQSEIDLDDVPHTAWDLVIHTDATPADQTTQLVISASGIRS
jgi:hypothetical protein